MTSDSLGDVAMTAVGVAFARSVESQRDDALFTDPFAQAFVDASSFAEWRARRRADGFGGDDRYRAGIGMWVTVRTRFLDDLVIDATHDGIRQVVMIGAGLDCRAFRLPLPAGTRCFEIDVPEMIAFKDRVLGASGAVPARERVTVACDLRNDWAGALAGAGFDPTTRSVWIAEGLLAYLPADANDELLSTMASLAPPGSRLGVTLARQRRDDASPIRTLWQSTAPDDAVAWLATLGWDATVYPVAERAASYGRPLPDDTTLSTARLVAATRI